MTNFCDNREERLVGLLYEDGDERDRALTRAHLAECAECRAELQELAGTRQLLSAWPNAVNAPRMVYVNEASNLSARLHGWVSGLLDRRLRLLGTLATAAAAIVVALGLVVLFELEVSPDGSLRVGRLAAPPVALTDAERPVTREELRAGLTDVVTLIEETLQERSEEQRGLLLAAIEERMQEQGLAMSRELRGTVDAAFVDLQQQHEGDLGLIFSAIDEMGVMTSAELQRIHSILGSLAMPAPSF